MIKPSRIKKSDKIAVVSLSRGVLGEPDVKHEVDLIEKRLHDVFGVEPVYMDNALKGIDFLRERPEARAADLEQAFRDPEIKAIWCAIGGDDTYRTLPYLMNAEFEKLVHNNPKPFLGFSDTTTNHLMFYKLGLQTYYAPALLTDVAELGPEMLTYTKGWLMELFEPTPKKQIEISPIWYDERKDFGPSQLGVEAVSHPEKHGFEFFGEGVVEGQLLGGCLEIFYDTICSKRYPDQKQIFEQFPVFPTQDEWKDKILFVETSEERPNPELHRQMLEALEEKGVFEQVKAVIVGKPQDEQYYDEYKQNIQAICEKYHLPFVFNLNFGHAAPRMVIPYGQPIKIDFETKQMQFLEPLVK